MRTQYQFLRLRPVADCTASGDFHPALKTVRSVVHASLYAFSGKMQPPIFKAGDENGTNFRFSLTSPAFWATMAVLDGRGGLRRGGEGHLLFYRLPWGTREEDPRCVALKGRIAAALEEEYAAGVRHFISGMARGADLYFAEAVLALKERRPDVLLECARPCESQADRWPEEERARYQSILDRCDYETLVQHRYDRFCMMRRNRYMVEYDRFCMMRRNRYMVDRSARLLAVYDGEPKGGTAQTLAYALRKGLHVTILELE